MTYHWDVIGCFIWDLFETSWRRTDGTSSLRPNETSSRHTNKTSWRRTTETSWRRSTETSLVFHLRRTCDVTGTYKETSLRHRHDVLLPGGSFLSTKELTAHLKQDMEKWRAMFHACIKLFTPTPVYVCLYYISGRKGSTTHSAHISQEQDKHNIYAIIHGNNVTSLLSHQWLRRNSCTWHMMNKVATVHHASKSWFAI